MNARWAWSSSPTRRATPCRTFSIRSAPLTPARSRSSWRTTDRLTALWRQAEQRDGVQLLRTGGNLGFGTAANRGFARIDPATELVLIANPDVVFHPGCIDTLVEAAR